MEKEKFELPENYTLLPLTKDTVAEFPLHSVNYTDTIGIKASHERNKWFNAMEGLNEERMNDNIEVHMSSYDDHMLSTLLP